MILQIIADGLILGATIALGAIGLTMTYSLLRFGNFAHGEFVTWGAYLTLTFLGFFLAAGPMAPIGPFSFGWELLAAMVFGGLATALLALALDKALFERLSVRGTAIALTIASFGAALALRNLLQFLYGPLPAYYTRELQIAIHFVPRDTLGGLRATPDQLAVLGLTLSLVVAMHLFLKYTATGRAMRAVAHNPALARITGIDVAAVVRLTWMLGGALAAVAGVFAGVVGQMRPQMGFDLLLPLFAAAILGGIGSVPGAVIGGLIVGLAE
ncbi:MAG: branched-chain amino acid ABC transporter permease, partial [Tagaea sp.]|nr:branched-chain amino acid ABC transporter permease [Tagaea sp.]